VKEEEMHLSDGQLLQELEIVGHLVAGEGEPVVPPGEGIFINRKKASIKNETGGIQGHLNMKRRKSTRSQEDRQERRRGVVTSTGKVGKETNLVQRHLPCSGTGRWSLLFHLGKIHKLGLSYSTAD
jgi:hypothetical protein